MNNNAPYAHIPKRQTLNSDWIFLYTLVSSLSTHISLDLDREGLIQDK